MSIFDLLKRKSLNVFNNNSSFQTSTKSPVPSQYSQNSSNSIVTQNGYYDFTRFSKEENDTIQNVLNNVKSKYPQQYQSIGLAMESYGIIYKPRYILHEIIILKYANSLNPVDRLAVGLAYATKGAAHRESALFYIENSINKIAPADMNFISYFFTPWQMYCILSDLCEKEYRFDDALKYAKLIISNRDEICPADILRIGEIYRKTNINHCIEYYESLLTNNQVKQYHNLINQELKKAKELKSNGYVYRPKKRKKSETNMELDKQIQAAAIRFI